MLNRNIKWLSLGDVPLKSDFNNPTSKEVSIGEFKRRIASNIFEKLTIEIKVKMSRYENIIIGNGFRAMITAYVSASKNKQTLLITHSKILEVLHL